MNRPCETCAFGEQGAAEESDNHLVAMICVTGAIPFFCHHAKDGEEYDWRSDPLGPLRLHPENRKVCAGWQDNVRKLKDSGYYREYLPIRRYVARCAIGLLKRFLHPDIGRGKRKQAQHDLKRCLKFLGKRDIAKETIPL